MLITFQKPGHLQINRLYASDMWQFEATLKLHSKKKMLCFKIEVVVLVENETLPEKAHTYTLFPHFLCSVFFFTNEMAPSCGRSGYFTDLPPPAIFNRRHLEYTATFLSNFQAIWQTVNFSFTVCLPEN